MTRGGGLKRFCSELISSLRKTATSESRESGGLRPRDQVNCSFSRSHWSRGGGYLSYRYLLSPLSGGPSRDFPGKSEGGKQHCSRNRLTSCRGLSVCHTPRAIERRITLSGCGGSRTREARRFLRPCLYRDTPCDSFPRLDGSRRGITPGPFSDPGRKTTTGCWVCDNPNSPKSFSRARYQSSCGRRSACNDGSFRWTPRRSAHRTMP